MFQGEGEEEIGYINMIVQQGTGEQHASVKKINVFFLQLNVAFLFHFYFPVEQVILSGLFSWFSFVFFFFFTVSAAAHNSC